MGEKERGRGKQGEKERKERGGKEIGEREERGERKGIGGEEER